MKKAFHQGRKGVYLAFIVLLFWVAHLMYTLIFVEVSLLNPWLYVHVFIQTHLFTGLFITGHDGMHGTIWPGHKTVNQTIGTLATFCYAGLSFKKLKANHSKHHRMPGVAGDPDYCEWSQNFFVWYFTFMWRYLTIWQMLIMAVLFNVLKMRFSELQLITLWIVPAILSTLQMFYFGVYAPHRLPHTPDMMPSRSRTQHKNHLWAFVSCYFFGYHHEHHDSPDTPWWRLYLSKP